jgi:DNA-binding NarL/FixJ family response regulator
MSGGEIGQTADPAGRDWRARKGLTMSLEGSRILVLEDHFLVANDLELALTELGASIVGPTASVDVALAWIARGEVDAAIVDLDLNGRLSFAVADALMAQAIPFIFATGFSANSIPDRFAAIRCCEKPFDARRVAAALLRDEVC